MNCPRCNGLMLKDNYIGSENPILNWVSSEMYWGCSNCGCWLDKVILKNKSAQAKGGLQRVKIQLGRNDVDNKKINEKSYLLDGLKPSDPAPKGYGRPHIHLNRYNMGD